MNILDIKMQENDAGADTVKEYLIALLLNVWSEEEGFSGKRPFGNSGWKYEIYEALAVAGAIESEIITYGEGEDAYTEIDYGMKEIKIADALIIEAIKSI